MEIFEFKIFKMKVNFAQVTCMLETFLSGKLFKIGNMNGILETKIKYWKYIKALAPKLGVMKYVALDTPGLSISIYEW